MRLKDVLESNTTSNGGEYGTPNAFSQTPPSAEDKRKKKKRIPDEYDEPSLRYHSVDELARRIHTLINEISYTEFKQDDSMSAKQKINHGIKEISTKLFEMERNVKRLSKLKTEVGADQTIFMKSTLSKFTKINERLLKLSNQIRELNK